MIETKVTTETITEPTISLPPGTIVGYRANGQPIYNIAGGSIEVTDDAEEDDEDTSLESDDDDDSEDEEDKWVPPSKEDFEKLLAAKAKADSEAASRKRFLREAGLDPKTGKPIAKKVELDLGEDDDESDTPVPKAEKPKGPSKADLQRQLEREIAKAEQRERAKGTRLISAVPEALEDAGWNGRNMNRMLKLLDLDAVEVDADGEVDGLKEQIDELKKDFPEFFKRQRMKDAAKEIADTSTVGGGKKKVAPQAEAKDWASAIAEAMVRGQ